MAMEPPLHLNPVKERRIKRAAGCRCELCGGVHPADVLEIHLLPGDGRQVNPGPDLQREILILCPACHRELHAFRIPRADQKILIRSRHPAARREIRRILGYNPEPYSPPDDIDLAAIFEEAHQLAGLFRVI